MYGSETAKRGGPPRVFAPPSVPAAAPDRPGESPSQRLRRAIGAGAPMPHVCVHGGRDSRGRLVAFVYSLTRNGAGYFVYWRERSGLERDRYGIAATAAGARRSCMARAAAAAAARRKRTGAAPAEAAR